MLHELDRWDVFTVCLLHHLSTLKGNQHTLCDSLFERTLLIPYITILAPNTAGDAQHHHTGTQTYKHFSHPITFQYSSVYHSQSVL
jgi:hypothetical protein